MDCIIDKETALDEFARFCDAMDIDTEVDEMTDEEIVKRLHEEGLSHLVVKGKPKGRKIPKKEGVGRRVGAQIAAMLRKALGIKVPHTAAHMVVTSEKGNILLVQNKDGEWTLPGGTIDIQEHETPWEAGIRETMEETRIGIENVDVSEYMETKPYGKGKKKGLIYKGTVKKIMDFGAFVEIVPGKEGLVHISKLDFKRVEKVTDILNEGDEVDVKVIGIDKFGRIDLSRKDALKRE